MHSNDWDGDLPVASCVGVLGRARSFTDSCLAAAEKLASVSTRLMVSGKRSVPMSG